MRVPRAHDAVFKAMSWQTWGMHPGMHMPGVMNGMGVPMGMARQPPTPGVDGAWQCHACSNINYKSARRPATAAAGGQSAAHARVVVCAVRAVCNRCSAPKPSAQEAAEQRTEQVSQHSAQMLHGTNRRPNGEPIDGMDGNWGCKACSNVNFSKRDVCNRCFAPKPPPEELSARSQQLVEERKQVRPPCRRPSPPPPFPRPHSRLTTTSRCACCGRTWPQASRPEALKVRGWQWPRGLPTQSGSAATPAHVLFHLARGTACPLPSGRFAGL